MDKQNITKDDLYDVYINQQKSTREVAKLFNVSQRTIVVLLKQFSIPSRTLKTARSLAIEKGKIDFSHIIENARTNNEPWNKNTVGKQVAWNKNKHVPQISGSKHWNWQNGKSSKNKRLRLGLDGKLWRQRILARDNYKCNVCGSSLLLHVHHIKHFATNPELCHVDENGITLCKNCHLIVHQITNKIKKYGELLEHPEVHLATAQLERVIAIARKADEIGQSAAEPTDEKCCRKVQRSEHTPNRDEVH